MLAMTLKETAALTNRIAAANGFDRPSWDNIVIKLGLAISELDEAHDAVHGLADDPLEEELADTSIRILAMLNSLWDDDWTDRVTDRLNFNPKRIITFAPIEVLLWPTLKNLCKAMEKRRHDDREMARKHIELALLEVFWLADALDIDLMQEIAIKCEKNRRRDPLHGSKYAVG